MIVVRSARQLRGLDAELVRTRHDPVVLLALAVDADEPAFAPRQLRSVVGWRVRIYLLLGQHPFHRPAVVAGWRLAVPRGSARLCWPQFSARSDPDDHPLVHRLENESDRDALKAFARRFHLSEDIRATSGRELVEARARLSEVEQQRRDARIALHQAGQGGEGAQQPIPST